ncbi:MAG: cytidylyltransferase domain-containing protein [Bacteroidota bacterium]
MSVAIFLPVRKGSDRVPDKNNRKFADIEGGLLELKLQQLMKIGIVEEIIVSSNDKKSLEVILEYQEKDSRIIFSERPEHLGRSDTDLVDLIKHVPYLTNLEHILWTHCTSPFFDHRAYKQVIEKYVGFIRKGFDGLVTGRNYKDFLIDKQSGKLVNNNTQKAWPRTQDLADWFEINNAAFMTHRHNFELGNRTGKKPFYMEMDKMSSFDIDYEEDFKIAEAMYDRFKR